MTATTEGVISEMVERLVREFDPLRIVLFGSHARGDANRWSDVDLLVVLPEVEDERATADAMRAALRDVRVPNDVWATDPARIARSGDKVGAFLYPVLREGRVIYGVDDRDAGTWLRYAEEDLDTAERMVVGEGFALRWACYLAQQAAEKAIKALLVRVQVDFPFTHDLAALSLLLEEPVTSVALEGLVDLSKLAADSRYPGDAPEPVRADAETAVALARAVVAEVTGRFDGEG